MGAKAVSSGQELCMKRKASSECEANSVWGKESSTIIEAVFLNSMEEFPNVDAAGYFSSSQGKLEKSIIA